MLEIRLTEEYKREMEEHRYLLEKKPYTMTESKMDQKINEFMEAKKRAEEILAELYESRVSSSSKEKEDYLMDMLKFVHDEFEMAVEDADRMLMKGEDGHVFL